ncbi:hypothetical protein L1049_000174 [Liquidambar formosana]|uniref:Uncharacterized protein n=1 Tax=Liquidambar formosana TaxID=63359 RepID=A0AAP0R506_LIQFO
MATRRSLDLSRDRRRDNVTAIESPTDDWYTASTAKDGASSTTEEGASTSAVEVGALTSAAWLASTNLSPSYENSLCSFGSCLSQNVGRKTEHMGWKTGAGLCVEKREMKAVEEVMGDSYKHSFSRAGWLEESYDIIKCLPPGQSATALGDFACCLKS